MKIDIHTHILPPEIPKFKDIFGYGGFIHLDHCGECRAKMMRDDGKFFREVQSNTWDEATRIAEIKNTGVSKQVLSTVPVMFSYWAKPKDGDYVAKHLNDHIAGIVRDNSNYFYGLGTLPLQDTDLSIKELERCVKDLGLQGVQIGSHVNGANLDDPRLFPIFQAAQELNTSIFVHPWEMMAKERMEKYWLPWLVGMPAEISLAIASLIFSGVFEKLPKLRFAFAHGGGSFPAIIGRLQHGFDVRPDLCAVDNKVSPRDYLGKFYVDSLVHDRHTLDLIVEYVGEDKVCLGSDYPFPLGEAHPGKMIEEEMDWSKDRLEKVLYKNALKWLGIN